MGLSSDCGLADGEDFVRSQPEKGCVWGEGRRYRDLVLVRLSLELFRSRNGMNVTYN